MIGIKLDGDDEFLETDPDTRITLRLENPILGTPEKLSPGSFSYPFDLPAGDISPNNSFKLKNPNVIERTYPYQIQKASLFFEGVPFRSGNLKTNESGVNSISSNFTFGLNSIDETFKTAKLRSVLDEPAITISMSQTKKIYVKKVGSGDIKLNIGGSEYQYPNNSIGILDFAVFTASEAFEKTLDKDEVWHPIVQLASGSSPGGITGTYLLVKLVQYYTVSPGVYASRDATDPLLEMHVTTTDAPSDYLVEADLGTLLSDAKDFVAEYLNDSPYPDNKIRFPVRFNSRPFEDVVKATEGVNLVGTGGLILNDPNWGFTNSSPFKVRNNNSLQPFVLVKYVLDRIGVYFGFTWEGDFYESAWMSTALLDNSYSLDIAQNFIGDDKFLFWKRSFYLADLLPDITVVEFLKRIQTRYNLGVYYNEKSKRVRLIKREPIALSKSYHDVSSKASPIKSITDQRVTGIRLIVAADDSDTLSSKEIRNTGDDPEDDIEISCGRLFQTATKLVDSKSVTGPKVSQLFGAKGQMRVFHYTGLINTGTFVYPSSAIETAESKENIQELHEQYHKFWLIQTLNRRLVKVEVAFPFRDLRDIDFELKCRLDRYNYLIKSVSVTLSNKGCGVSDVELYTS